VVALLNVNATETAFQFLVINNKVTRVASSLIRTLALDYQEQELAKRLEGARLNLDKNLPYVGAIDTEEESPFKGNIDLASHEGNADQRFVAAAAIETALAHIQGTELQEINNEDSLCDFFYAMWSPIKERWPQLWVRDSKLLHKVGLVAMTIFMTDHLVKKFDWGDLDIADPAEVRRVSNQLLDTQTPDLWTSDWGVALSDKPVIRDKIIDSLTKVSRNIRAGLDWNDRVDILPRGPEQ
jgi:hypothetical protein